jgi:hypothetical protein
MKEVGKADLAEGTLSSLERFAQMASEKTKLSTRLKEVEEQLADLTASVATEITGLDTDKVRVKGLGVFAVRAELYAAIIENEAALQWLRKQGGETLIKTTVHPQTLRGWVRETEEEMAPPQVARFEEAARTHGVEITRKDKVSYAR